MFIAKNKYDGLQHKDTYLTLQAGTLFQLSEQLYEYLQENGYSVLFEDVLRVMCLETQYYASHAVLYAQRNSNQMFEIGAELLLETFEWAIIYPVVMAHCDLVQAKLMESSRSSSGESFGLSVSEANTNYTQAREKMQFEAFLEPPFTLFVPQ